MADLSTEYQIVLERIKELFVKKFDDTKRILISSEQLSGTTILDVFFDLSRILDEIYIMMDDPSEKNIKLRCNYIEGQFLAIQNQCIFIFVYNIKKELQKNKIEIKELEKIVSEMKTFLIEKNLYVENDSKPVIDKFKITFPNESEIEKIKESDSFTSCSRYCCTTSGFLPIFLSGFISLERKGISS